MSLKLIQTLTETRKALHSELETILNKTEAERRNFTSAEETRYNQGIADLRELNQRIETLVATETASQTAEQRMRGLGLNGGGRGLLGESDGAASEVRDLALGRRFEGLTIGPAAGEARAFVPAEARALSIGGGTSGSAGGVAVGKSLYTQIIEGMLSGSGVLAAGATVLTTPTGEDLVIPTEASKPAAALTAEAAAIGGSEPTFSSKTLRAYKYGVLVKVSRELLEDNAADLEGYLARSTGEALGRAFSAHALNGDGNAKPTGLLSQVTAGVTAPAGVATSLGSQAAAGQGTDLLEALIASVDPLYSQSSAAGFLMRPATLAALRMLKASTGELVGSQWLASAPRVTLDANMPAMAPGAEAVLYGDWSRVWVRVAGGVRFDRSDEYAFNTDEVTFRALTRMDIALVDSSGAIKSLTMGTAS